VDKTGSPLSGVAIVAIRVAVESVAVLAPAFRVLAFETVRVLAEAVLAGDFVFRVLAAVVAFDAAFVVLEVAFAVNVLAVLAVARVVARVVLPETERAKKSSF